MLITNFKKLARSSLRRKAFLIAEAGLEAIDIKKTINQKIKLKNNKLAVCSVMLHHNTEKCLEIDLDNYKNIFIIGIGKGSALASAALAKILGKRLTAGIVLDVQYENIRHSRDSTFQILTDNSKEVEPRHIDADSIWRGRTSGVKNQYLGGQASKTSDVQKLKIFFGTHPLPSKQNIKATQKIIKLAQSLAKDDLLIVFICGGGSALLCGSEQEMKNSILATKLLTEAGADISELNTVRKHLSEIKGGGLAKAAYPATVISLIVSDVPTAGNDLSMVASGPTVFDKTTKEKAKKIWEKYCNIRTFDALTCDVPDIKSENFWTSQVIKSKILDVQGLVRGLTETPKNKKYFKKVKNILFLSNREPILAMAEKAKKLGFKPRAYSLKLKGEAKNALLPLIKSAKKGEVVLAGGETTVKLKNKELRIKNYELGKGGRNMESVLGALGLIHNSTIMSVASDGRDNTEAAGAVADALTVKKAEKLKLNYSDFLDNHNSFHFFKKTGDLIFAKKTTFNVADLIIILKQ